MPDKFVKLMMMTTSLNDNEALAALRKANQILATKTVSWEQLIKGLKNVTFQIEAPKQAREPAPKPQPDPGIEKMFVAVFATLRDPGPTAARHTGAESPGRGSQSGPREFIESLNTFYKEKGFLTDKQLAALEKFYTNSLNRKT